MTTWSTILSTDTDQDSVIDETTMDAIRGNIDYLKEHLLKARGNTTYLDAASPTELSSQGVQMVVARGPKAWSGTTNGSGDLDIAVSVTFSSHAADGDPIFDSTVGDPILQVVLSLEEDTSSTAWPTLGIAPDQCIGVYMDHGQPTATGFTATVQINDFAASTLYRGYLHWFAFGGE